MTTVMLEGRKKWMMVQSVPDVSGRYAMNCDKGIEKIYYVSDDGDLTCAEDSFPVSYTHLDVYKRQELLQSGASGAH